MSNSSTLPIVIAVVAGLLAAGFLLADLLGHTNRLRDLDARMYESWLGWLMPFGISHKLGRRQGGDSRRWWPWLLGGPGNAWAFEVGRRRTETERAVDRPHSQISRNSARARLARVGRMVLEHALLPVTPGQGADFEAAFDEAKEIISAMPGFRKLTLSRCIEQPSSYLLLVEWDSLADHTEGFRGSAEYQQWRELLHHFYEPFPEVLHFDQVTAVG